MTLRPAAAAWPPWLSSSSRALGQRRVQVEPRHAAGRADARLHAQRVESDDDGRQAVLFGEPAGDDADDAGMPLAVGQHQGGVAAGVELFAGLLLGAARDAALERLPLVVELLDVLGELLGPLGAVGGEQLDAELGLPEAAGGVEPRADDEGEVFAVDLPLVVQLASVAAARPRRSSGKRAGN